MGSLMLSMLKLPFDNRPDKNGKAVSGWRCDKKRLDEKTALFTKLEIYRYFKDKELKALVNFVETTLKPVPKKEVLPKPISAMLKLDGEVYRNKGGIMQKFLRLELHRAEILYPNEYLYENLFMKPILHRGKVYLIRIYKLALERDNRQQIKLEITFFDNAPTDRRGFKENLKKAKQKISAMEELTKRFDSHFKKQGGFTDHTPNSFTLQGLKRWLTTKSKSTYKQLGKPKPSSFEVGVLKKIIEKR
jgi:hypothetical protein